MELHKIVESLSGVFYIATTDGDQPHVRPFDGAVENSFSVYIGTNRQKDVFKQIEKNPKVEIFSMENGVIRFTAEAYPVEDEAKNQEIYESLGKEYSDGCVAIELKNMRGNFTDSMGEKTKFIINAE